MWVTWMPSRKRRARNSRCNPAQAELGALRGQHFDRRLDREIEVDTFRNGLLVRPWARRARLAHFPAAKFACVTHSTGRTGGFRSRRQHGIQARYT